MVWPGAREDGGENGRERKMKEKWEGTCVRVREKEMKKMEEIKKNERLWACVGLEGRKSFLQNNPQPHTWLWIRPNLGLLPILAYIISKL
jgi:hypothetical protein